MSSVKPSITSHMNELNVWMEMDCTWKMLDQILQVLLLCLDLGKIKLIMSGYLFQNSLDIFLWDWEFLEHFVYNGIRANIWNHIEQNRRNPFFMTGECQECQFQHVVAVRALISLISR